MHGGCSTIAASLRNHDRADTRACSCAEKNIDRLAGFNSVKCLAFSSDGCLVALGGEDGSITVVEYLTLRVLVDIRQGLLLATWLYFTYSRPFMHHISVK